MKNLKGVWQDVSSYSRDDKVREPKSFELETHGGIRIDVTRYYGLPPDMWVMHCPNFNINCHELKSKDLKEAQEEAVMKIKRLLTQALSSLEP